MEAIAFYFLKSGIWIALSRHPERGVAESKDLMLIARPLLSWDSSTRLRLAQNDGVEIRCITPKFYSNSTTVIPEPPNCTCSS